MRTTVTLDDDILRAARSLADVERRTLGEVISDLARRGLAPAPLGEADGLPVFRVAPGTPPLTTEMVREALDD